MKRMQRKNVPALKILIYENKEMQEKYKLLTEAVMKKAEALNRQRILTGCEFTEKIISLLQDMGMDDPRMTLHLIPAAAPVSSGVEEMELYFSANRGESLRSMKETASGRRTIENCISHRNRNFTVDERTNSCF